MPLNNVATQDTYSPSATFTTLPVTILTVQVNNAAVYYTLYVIYGGSIPGRPGDYFTGPGGTALAERFLQPGDWTFSADDFQGGKCVGISFRGALVGAPAQVSAS